MELHQLIGGQWVSGRGPELLSTNPAHPDDVVASGRLASGDQVDAAVAAATGAAAAWAARPYHERAQVLLGAAAVLEREGQRYGRELTREEGKTLAEGIGEVLRAAQILRYCAGEADREAGQVFHSPRGGQRILVVHRPVGVVGVITPFNFPIAIPAWKIAPALVHGNTVVWKPAGVVPLLAVRLAQALQEAGLPSGVLNLVIADARTGSRIVEHPDVHAVTFTGSTGVGRAIAATCAQRGAAVQAEMGGKNPAVVLADADLDVAVEQIMLGAFRSTGQKCTATSRLVVQDPVADELLDRLQARLASLVVGDPLDAATGMGPLISDSARATVEDGVQRALHQGASAVVPGRPDLPGHGWFSAPRVLVLPSTELDVWRTELFGPVLSVVRAASVQEAFALAGEGEYGLSAAVFTTDLASALSAVDTLDVGVLHINDESAGADPHVPFGGGRHSSLGPKEQGTASRQFFTKTTTVYLRG